MKKVMMFHLSSCPYCRAARSWMEELKAEHPEYAAVDVEMIEERENAALADTYDYYYVPTYYVDGVKVHEGAASKKIVEDVYKRALAD